MGDGGWKESQTRLTPTLAIVVSLVVLLVVLTIVMLPIVSVLGITAAEDSFRHDALGWDISLKMGILASSAADSPVVVLVQGPWAESSVDLYLGVKVEVDPQLQGEDYSVAVGTANTPDVPPVSQENVEVRRGRGELLDVVVEREVGVSLQPEDVGVMIPVDGA